MAQGEKNEKSCDPEVNEIKLVTGYHQNVEYNQATTDRVFTKNGLAIIKIPEASSMPNSKEAGQRLDLNVVGCVVWWKISGSWGFRDGGWPPGIDSYHEGGWGGVYVTPKLIVSSSVTGDNNFKVFHGINSIKIAVCFRTELLNVTGPR